MQVQLDFEVEQGSQYLSCVLSPASNSLVTYVKCEDAAKPSTNANFAQFAVFDTLPASRRPLVADCYQVFTGLQALCELEDEQDMGPLDVGVPSAARCQQLQRIASIYRAKLAAHMGRLEVSQPGFRCRILHDSWCARIGAVSWRFRRGRGPHHQRSHPFQNIV